MIYSPQLSEKAAVSVRSLSWALGLPMTKTIERALQLMPLVIHPVLVCQKCQDQERCAYCAFNRANIGEDIKKLMPAQD